MRMALRYALEHLEFVPESEKRKKELSGLLEKNGATHHAPLRLEFLFHQTVFITVKIQEPMSPQPEASFRILFRIQLQKLQLI